MRVDHQVSNTLCVKASDIGSSPLLPVEFVWDIPFESTCVPRFAAETAVHSDQATTAASRVILALGHFVDESRLALQHGLERWLVRVDGDTVPFQTVAHGKMVDGCR